MIKFNYIDHLLKCSLSSIKNLHFCRSFLNKCRDEVFSGKQLRYKSVNYSLNGEMYSSMNIGLNRSIQEDSTLIVKHPADLNYKFLIVADGMGGAECGEYASNFVTKKMLEWFESLDVNFFEDVNLMSQLFQDALMNVDSMLYHNNRERGIDSGTTFVGAIIGKCHSVVCSVGDSRAYCYSSGVLYRITEDDSSVQVLRNRGIIENDDDMRFHVGSNFVTQCLGGIKRAVPHVYQLSNLSYEYLILFSDGVVDCLSYKQLNDIIKNTKFSKISKKIVKNSLNTNSYIRDELQNDDNYKKCILGGKDNISAVLVKSVRK